MKIKAYKGTKLVYEVEGKTFKQATIALKAAVVIAHIGSGMAPPFAAQPAYIIGYLIESGICDKVSVID